MHHLKSNVRQLLRRSERHFKLDMIYLAKSGLWTTGSFLISAISSVITMIAFGSLLARETYGTYSYLLSLGASLSFLTFSGMGPAVMRAVARGYENVVPTALRMQLKYNTIAILTVMIAAFYYGYKGNWLFALSLAMLALAYPLSEAFHIYAQILTGKKRFDIMTKITSVINLGGAIVTVVTLLLTQNILILIAVYATMMLLPNILAYIKITERLKKTEPEKNQLDEMKRTAFHFTGAGIIGVVALYIDKIILFQVAGPASLAVYGFASAGPERLKSLIKNWTSVALPRLAQSSLHQIRRVIYRRIGFSLVVGFCLALVYILLAPYLFKLLLPLYMDAVVYSQALALGLVVVPAVVFIGSVFASQNMLKATYALNFGSQIARILLFVVCGWLWQIWGLVVATIASYVFNALYSLIIWEVEIRRLIKKAQ